MGQTTETIREEKKKKENRTVGPAEYSKTPAAHEIFFTSPLGAYIPSFNKRPPRPPTGWNKITSEIAGPLP